MLLDKNLDLIDEKELDKAKYHIFDKKVYFLLENETYIDIDFDVIMKLSDIIRIIEFKRDKKLPIYKLARCECNSGIKLEKVIVKDLILYLGICNTCHWIKELSFEGTK